MILNSFTDTTPAPGFKQYNREDLEEIPPGTFLLDTDGDLLMRTGEDYLLGYAFVTLHRPEDPDIGAHFGADLIAWPAVVVEVTAEYRKVVA